MPRPPKALTGFLLAIALASCGDRQKQPAAAAPPPAVTVAKPGTRTVVDHDEYVGRFVAVDSVEIRSRVSGYLESIHFQDGQTVKQGDLLFTIDRRPFQNALDQARANLGQARASLAYAEADLARAQTLLKERTISEQLFDQRVQSQRVAQASVAANEAMVRQAALDLDFTELRAPVSGRIGDRRVSPGNLVTGGTSGNTSLLATIVSLDPIRFEFTFDEASYLRYKRIMGGVEARENKLPVELKLIDESDYSHKGVLNFLDNVIDRSTGTIRGRAEFANPKLLFTPGMFGRLRVPASPPYEAMVVPEIAIGTEQTRKFVLTVDAENTVHPKYLQLGQLTDGGMRVVKSGLAFEDSVIVNGMARARPGIKVAPQAEGAPGTPPGPQAKTN